MADSKTRNKKREPKVEKPSEQEKVEAWRRREFSRLLPTLEFEVIETLTMDKMVDLRQAEGMKRNGCSDELIASILT